MTSVVSILQVIRDAAQRVYSFSNDQAGWGSLMAMATFGRGSNYTGNGSAWPSASTGSGLELKENLCPCMGKGCQMIDCLSVLLEGRLSWNGFYRGACCSWIVTDAIRNVGAQQGKCIYCFTIVFLYGTYFQQQLDKLPSQVSQSWKSILITEYWICADRWLRNHSFYPRFTTTLPVFLINIMCQ